MASAVGVQPAAPEFRRHASVAGASRCLREHFIADFHAEFGGRQQSPISVHRAVIHEATSYGEVTYQQ